MSFRAIVTANGEPLKPTDTVPAEQVRILCEYGFHQGYVRGWYSGLLTGLGLALIIAATAYMVAA